MAATTGIEGQADRSLGIHLRGDDLYALVVDPAGSVVVRREVRSASPSVIDTLIELIGEILRDLSDIRSVGVAVPGLVDDQSGRIVYSSLFSGLSGLDLRTVLSEAIGRPIIVQNDANAEALAESILGAGRGCRNMFYATLGQGVGGAFVIDGQIWQGSRGFAGEFGYLTLNSEGIRLEEVASADNIVRRTRSRFNQDSTSSLNLLDETNISLESIIRAAENKDDFSQMMLERTGTYLGTCVAAVINLLNVERVVLGGEIMKARHLVLNAVKRRARELSFRPAYETCEIVEAELGSDSAALGAALSAGIQCKET